jgi:hypothetical protein
LDVACALTSNSIERLTEHVEVFNEHGRENLDFCRALMFLSSSAVMKERLYQFLSEALLNLWGLTPNPRERIRLNDIYNVIAEEFPNLSWSAFRMSVRRRDPSLFKHPFLYGPLIHKDDVYRVFTFSNCSTIDNEKTIAIVGTAGQRLMNDYRNAALIEEISFGIGDQSFTVPEVDSESSPPSATRKKPDTLYFLCEKVTSEWNNVDVDSNLFFEFGGNVMDRIKVDLLESQQRVGNESWSIPVNDVLFVCYLSKTIYFKGLSVFLSKIYMREFRRKSLLTCAAVICTLQAQLRYRDPWSNWFEILRMILMNGDPPSFFQDVLIKSHVTFGSAWKQSSSIKGVH